MILYGYKIDLYDETVMKEIGATLLTAEDHSQYAYLSEGKFAASLVRANNENLYEYMTEYLNKIESLEHYIKAFKNGALFIGRSLDLSEDGEDLTQYTLQEFQTQKFFNRFCWSEGKLYLLT